MSDVIQENNILSPEDLPNHNV